MFLVVVWLSVDNTIVRDGVASQDSQNPARRLLSVYSGACVRVLFSLCHSWSVSRGRLD